MSDIDPLQALLSEDINTFSTKNNLSADEDTAELLVQANKTSKAQVETDLFSKPRSKNKAIFDDDDDDDNGDNDEITDTLEQEIASLKLQREKEIQSLSETPTPTLATQAPAPSVGSGTNPSSRKQPSEVDHNDIPTTGLFDALAEKSKKQPMTSTHLLFDDDDEPPVALTGTSSTSDARTKAGFGGLNNDSDKPLFIPADAIDPNSQSIEDEVNAFKQKTKVTDDLINTEDDLSIFQTTESTPSPQTTTTTAPATKAPQHASSFDMSLFDDDDNDDSPANTKDTQSILNTMNPPASSSLFDDNDLFANDTQQSSSSLLASMDIGDDFDFNSYLNQQSK